MRSLFALFLGVTTIACSPDPEGTSAEEAVEKPTLTIYSGRSESLVGPIFDKLEAEGKFNLQVQYGDTAEMVTRLITEGSESPADLIFAQDSGHLGVLAAKDLLTPLPETLLEQVDTRFQSTDKLWIGTSGRLRVLVYNTQSLNADSLPASLRELADPKWKGRLGWAPTNGSFQAHLSALRHAWGEEETEAWLNGVLANAPTAYPKNSPQVAAAHVGEIDIGWVNHYYLHRLDPTDRNASNWSFSAEEDAGNVLMVAGVGIRAGSPHEAEAHALIEHLISESTQAYFASEVYEYPTRPGVMTHADVQPLEEISLAPVDQSHMADLGPTRELLQRLGLM